MLDNQILAGSRNLVLVSRLDDVTIADSFVKRINKIGSANGEAKLYVGHDSPDMWEFFGSPGFSINCFLFKSDLLDLLVDLKGEYFNPTQAYRYVDADKLKLLWESRAGEVASLYEEEYFDAFEQVQIRGSRVYIKSNSKIFSLIRELCLPNVTKLIIVKYQDELGHFFYRFLPRISCQRNA